MRVNKRFVQGLEDTRGQGREGSLKVEQHPSGFIGSSDDIIFSTGPGVEDNAQVFGGGDCWYSLGLCGLWDVRV